MSYVLGLAGSPREGGNSRLLLQAALEGVRENRRATEEVILADFNIQPCIECGGCDETGKCILEDDMDYLYQKIKESSGLIFSTPIFFGHLPAQAKAAIDRFQAWWVARYILEEPYFEKKRPGALIVVGGMNRPDYFDSIKRTVKAFFATAGFELFFELYIPQIDEKGAILKRKDFLEQAFEIGRQLGDKVKKPLER